MNRIEESDGRREIFSDLHVWGSCNLMEGEQLGVPCSMMKPVGMMERWLDPSYKFKFWRLFCRAPLCVK